MIKGFLVVCLIALAGYASGQHVWDYPGKKADSLRKSGIDTIILYGPWSDPLMTESTDAFWVYDRGYIFWKKGQQSFILQYYEYRFIDGEGHGVSIKERVLPDTPDLFGYLRDHFQQVLTDTLLPARLRTVKDNKEFFEDINNSDVKDDGYTGITVLVGDKRYNNSYSGTYFIDTRFLFLAATPKAPPEQWTNLNYQANVNKAIYQFITRIEKQVNLLFGWDRNTYTGQKHISADN